MLCCYNRGLCFCLVLSAWCSVLSAGCQVLSAQCLVLGAQCSVLSAQCLVLSAGYKVTKLHHNNLHPSPISLSLLALRRIAARPSLFHMFVDDVPGYCPANKIHGQQK